MAENPANIRSVCAEHAPKPVGYEGDATALVGKFVKRAFTDEEKHVEHMWVKVQEVTADGVLRGKLDNDPVLVNGVKCGDTVTVRLCEIEEVL